MYIPAGVDALVVKVKTETDEIPGESCSGLIVKVTEAPAAEAGSMAEKATFPERPLLESVSVELAEPPAPMVDGVGVEADKVKSGWTVTDTIAVWASGPFPAVIVIV